MGEREGWERETRQHERAEVKVGREYTGSRFSGFPF